MTYRGSIFGLKSKAEAQVVIWVGSNDTVPLFVFAFISKGYNCRFYRCLKKE